MSDQPRYSFLSGGGEMGKLTREKDWKSTQVGDPSVWPQSLRTTIYTILHSRFPKFLWWGEDLICFYNDAYRPSLGENGKHPIILGIPAAQAWPEIWDTIKPLIDQVLKGESVWSEDQLIPIYRNNRLEDVYWTFSYSPVMGESGKPTGVLVTCQETTEKIKILNELKGREDQLLFTLEAADLGTWDLDPVTNRFTGNARLKEWFGLKPEAEIELSLAMASIAECDRERVANDIARALLFESGGFYESEYAIIHPATGIEKRVVAKGRALFNEDKTARRFSGTLQDLTSEIKAFEQLKANEGRLNLVIEASGLGIWEWRPGSEEIIYSERYLEIFGFEQDTKISHTEILQRFHPEDLPARDLAIRRAMETGVVFYEARIFWSDGSVRWIQTRGRFYLDKNNIPYQANGTLEDITEEKRRQQELMASEAKFRLLADSMAQFVWTADPEGNLNYFNHSVFEFSGLTPESISGGGWLQIVHPDDRPGNIEKWSRAIHTGQHFYFEHRFRSKDGIYRWQLSRAIPQRDELGSIRMWVGTSTDIEEQKNFATLLEKQVRERTVELENKNLQLQKLNEELESFAYISSHDLQEPLRKIQVLVSIIQQKEYQSLPDTVKDYFSRIRVSANRMQKLIEDLLTYSRTGTSAHHFEPTDLSLIVSEAVDSFREQIKTKKAILDLGPFCTAEVIPFQFTQLMTNLIGNALKFTRENVEPHITIHSEIVSPENTQCHISITDNGIGFEPEYRQKIFEVFQRLHNRQDYAGTGIGLSIVKKIVETHQGSIEAHGQPGVGSRFDIFIPLQHKTEAGV